jgi:hypothetical protein
MIDKNNKTSTSENHAIQPVDQLSRFTNIKPQPESANQSSLEITSKSGSTIVPLHQSVDSRNVNFQLQFEIQRLNDSLRNINQLLNMSPSQELDQSSQTLPDQMNQSQQSWLDPNVSDKLSQSIGLFTNVMDQVKKQDNFQQIQEQGFMYSQQFSRGQLPRLDSQYSLPSESNYSPHDARALQSHQVLPSSQSLQRPPTLQQPSKS